MPESSFRMLLFFNSNALDTFDRIGATQQEERHMAWPAAEIIHKSLSYLRPYKLLLAKFSSIAVRLALPREDLDI